MFLFNTKPISHFCLLALGIAVQGNGFLSNTSWSQLEILGTWVRIKGRWGSKESGLPGATTTRVPAPKFNFPQPSVVTLWRTPLQNGFPRRRQRLNEDKRLTGKQSCYKMRELHDMRYKLSPPFSSNFSYCKTPRMMLPRAALPRLQGQRVALLGLTKTRFREDWALQW